MKNTDASHLPHGRPARVELSIVIVCLNALAHLKETLDSLGSFPDWTLCTYVVDGDSNDGTPAYLANCPVPIAGWISERDQGIYDAMNKGWNMAAENSFVLFLGAGDKLLSLPSPEKVLDDRRDGNDIILGSCDMGTFVFQSFWYSRLYLSNTAHHQTLMVHKSVWPKSPFDTKFKVYGDWEFNIRLFAMGKTAKHYEEFRSYALPGGISSRVHLVETFKVAYRHGGLRKGIHASLRLLRVTAKDRLEKFNSSK